MSVALTGWPCQVVVFEANQALNGFLWQTTHQTLRPKLRPVTVEGFPFLVHRLGYIQRDVYLLVRPAAAFVALQLLGVYPCTLQAIPQRFEEGAGQGGVEQALRLPGRASP